MAAILAIDPGPEKSAVVLLIDGKPVKHLYDHNLAVLGMLGAIQSGHWWNGDGDIRLVLERIACYGMAVGAEVFETCVWTGRFMQRWKDCDRGFDRLYRRDVKLHLCGSARAKDANVRAALLDRYGPGRETAIGTKKKPGPCYGISGDCWAALGVAVTYYDRLRGMCDPAKTVKVPA